MNLKSRITIAAGWILVSVSVAGAQQLRPVSAQAQMKPLGAPSAVDRYRSPTTQNSRLQNSEPQNDSRQWVETQTQVQQAQFTIPPASQPLTAPPTSLTAPPSGFTAPPAGSIPSPSSLPMPPSLGGQTLGGSALGGSTLGGSALGGSAAGDLTPLPQPRLGGVPFGGVSAGPNSNGFATLNNCNQVSGPSGYSAALYSSQGGCAPVSYQAPFATTGVPPNPFAGQSVAGAQGIPLGSQGVPLGAVAPGGTSAPAGALLSFGQEAYPVQVGQGILGQPTAYVPGQPVRNWFRYLTP